MKQTTTDRTEEYVNWNDEIPVIQYQALIDTGCVEHGFSTRLGGVSQGIYDSMNLSYARGDDPSCVTENFKRFCSKLHMDWEKIVSTDQTHTANVRLVTEKDAGHGITVPKIHFDVDGQVTNVPGLPLISYHADCVPVFFVDPIKKAIGLSHSGWKGTVGRIGANTVKMMQEHFGSEPKDIICAIGPSICQSCYEVSEDVIVQFQESFEEKFWPELFYGKENGKYQLNLWRANELIFEEAGILKEHYSTTNICTCCNPGYLFSHRASHGKRGNLGAFLQIKE